MPGRELLVINLVENFNAQRTVRDLHSSATQSDGFIMSQNKERRLPRTHRFGRTLKIDRKRVQLPGNRSDWSIGANRFPSTQLDQALGPPGVPEKSFPRQLKLRLVTTDRTQLDRRFGGSLSNCLRAIKKRGALAVHDIAPHRHRRFAKKAFA